MDYLKHAVFICDSFEQQTVYPPYGMDDCNGKLECPDKRYIQRIARELKDVHEQGKMFKIKWSTIRGLHVVGE